MSIATIQGVSALANRVFSAINDIVIIEHKEGKHGEISFTLTTVSFTPRLALFKLRLWLSFLRPHRRMTNIDFNGVLEQGIILKLFQFTIKTELLSVSVE